jgi:hypothetical protein
MRIFAEPTRPTARPVPRWARTAAILAALSPVPSSLWRLPLMFGVSMGMDAEFMDSMMGHPFWQRAGYLLGLGLVSDGTAFLTLGLVRWWGETWPRWIPGLGGRRVHPMAAIVPATAGGLAVSALWIPAMFGWTSNVTQLNGWTVLMTCCYAPLVLWGPSLLAVTAAYARRRSISPDTTASTRPAAASAAPTRLGHS